MSEGLQFNDIRERHFAADFADRYFSTNRKTLILVCLSISLWMLWLDRALPLGMAPQAVAAMTIVALAGVVLAMVSLLDAIKLRMSLLLCFYVLGLQVGLIVASFDPGLDHSLPQIALPLLLPGILLRLRFVYVLPFALLIWVLQFFSVNFLTHSNLIIYSQWAQLTTLLLIANLVASYQFEQECRRGFAALFPQHALQPERTEHAP